MRVHRPDPVPELHEKLVLWNPGDEVRALDFSGFETRNESTLGLIARAEEAHGLPAFPPTLVNTADQPVNRKDPRWRALSYSTAAGFDDLPVPDFLFDGWPQTGIGDYEEARARLAGAGAEPAQAPTAGWIGASDTNPARRALLELGRRHPDLLDVRDVSWVRGSGGGGGPMTTAAGNYLSLDEQVRSWTLLIDVEGNGWSARLKLLLASGRPVLVQERPWREWFFRLLRPGVHYLPVRADLSDLAAQVEWAQTHPAEAARIGRDGQRFAREHLRRTDAVRRWAEALHELAALPELPVAPPEAVPFITEEIRRAG
jgi:hypothetical protein